MRDLLSCGDVQDLILRWHKLTPEEQQQVYQHLTICPTCQEFLEEEQYLRQILNQWAGNLLVKRFQWARAVTALVGTVALLLLVLTAWLFRPPPEGPSWGAVMVRAVLPSDTPVVVTVGETRRAITQIQGRQFRTVLWVQLIPRLPEVQVIAQAPTEQGGVP